MGQRDRTLDIFRGFGILFVVLGHIYQTPMMIRLWVCTFHMPLFFMCSGMLFSVDRYNGFMNFLKKKLQTLVLPYFCLSLSLWGLMNLRALAMVKLGITGGYFLSDVRQMVLAILLSDRMHDHYFSLWFVCALFLSELLFYPIIRYGGKNTYAIGAVAIGMNFVQCLLSHYIQGGIWSFDLVPTCISFMAVGFLMQKHKGVVKHLIKPWVFVICLGLNIIFAVLNTRVLDGGYTALFYGQLGHPVWYFMAALTGAMAVFIFSSLAERLVVTEFFGRNSLVIYAFQNSLAIPAANDLFGMAVARNEIFKDNVLQWIFVVAVTLAITSALSWMINHLTPWMLGRFPKKKPAVSK